MNKSMLDDEREFNITLLSNASTHLMPNNTLYNFANVFTTPFIFPRGEGWSVALHSVALSSKVMQDHAMIRQIMTLNTGIHGQMTKMKEWRQEIKKYQKAIAEKQSIAARNTPRAGKLKQQQQHIVEEMTPPLPTASKLQQETKISPPPVDTLQAVVEEETAPPLPTADKLQSVETISEQVEEEETIPPLPTPESLRVRQNTSKATRRRELAWLYEAEYRKKIAELRDKVSAAGSLSRDAYATVQMLTFSLVGKYNPVYVQCSIADNGNPSNRNCIGSFRLDPSSGSIFHFTNQNLTFYPINKAYVPSISIKIVDNEGHVLKGEVAAPTIVALRFRRMQEERYEYYTHLVSSQLDDDPLDFYTLFPPKISAVGGCVTSLPSYSRFHQIPS